MHRETIELRDAWNKIEKTVEIIWVEKDVTWVDSGRENIGATMILWGGDDCPIFVRRSPVSGSEQLYAPPTEVTGDYAEVFEPFRVYKVEDLDEGYYLVRKVR